MAFEINFDHEELNSEIAESSEKIFMTMDEAESVLLKSEQLFFKLNSCPDKSDSLNGSDFYLEYVSPIPQLFSTCFTKNVSLLNDNQNDICKSMLEKYIQAAEFCMKTLLICLAKSEIVSSISTVQVSLDILHQAYAHCNDSETYYGEMFESFTDHLGNFYNLIQELQAATLNILEEFINLNSLNYENEMENIALITNIVGKLCTFVTSLDRMTAIKLWKIFLRLISTYTGILQNTAEIDEILVSLVLDIKNIVNTCIINIEENIKIDESEIKMCIFELSTFKKIIVLFGNDLKNDTILELRDLFMLLYSSLIQSCSTTNTEANNMNILKILLKTAKPTVVSALSIDAFWESIFNCDPKDVPENMFTSLILLKLTAIDYLRLSSSDCPLLQSGELLTKYFLSLKANNVKDDFQFVFLKIPGSLFKDIEKDKTDLLTLYDHSYQLLTSCCKTISSDIEANSLEKDLLTLYKSTSDVVALLISDVWIYYLRCGSVNRIFKSCELLSNELISDSINPRIKTLLMRMLKFLPTEYKMDLFDTQRHLYHVLSDYNIVCRFGLSPCISPLPECHVLYNKINSLLSNLSSSPVATLEKKDSFVLNLGTSCSNKFLPADIIKLLEYAIAINGAETYDVQNLIIMLLKSLKGRRLSTNNQEVDVLTSAIATLLSDLMRSSNYITKLDSFNLYFDFAQSTPHSGIIKKTVMKCSSLISHIKSYAEKIPASGLLNEKQIQDMFIKKLVH